MLLGSQPDLRYHSRFTIIEEISQGTSLKANNRDLSLSVAATSRMRLVVLNSRPTSPHFPCADAGAVCDSGADTNDYQLANLLIP